jgi:fucose permease
MANANEVLGLLHGVYGLGAVLAPLIATSMIARAQMPWFNFYYVMVRPQAIYFLLLEIHAKND